MADAIPMPTIAREQFEALTRASVRLLEPLLSPDWQLDQPRHAPVLRQAFESCADLADALQLRAVRQICAPLLARLALPSDNHAWLALREYIESWLDDFIALCGGQLETADISRLVACVKACPWEPALSGAQSVLLAQSLAEDLLTIAGLLEQESGEQSGHAKAPEGVPPVSNDALDAVDVFAAAAPALAADELALIAAEADELAERFAILRREPGIAQDAGEAVSAQQVAAPADLPARDELLEFAEQRLTAIIQASTLIGLSELASVLDRALASVRRWREDVAQMEASALVLLNELPRRLASYLRHPSQASALALLQLSSDADWPMPLAGDAIEAMAASLGSINLIGSRQAEVRTETVRAEDLSLQISQEADPETVEQIIRELASVAEPFYGHVNRAMQGSQQDLQAARRIAHTLKGAANTVDVRGVATLTHLLEDLLQALGDEPQSQLDPLTGEPSELAQTLLAAADCLGEMADALAGHCEPPPDALQLCQALQHWTTRVAEEHGSTSLTPALRTLPTQPISPSATQPNASPIAQPIAQEARDRSASIRIPAALVDRMVQINAEATSLFAQTAEQLEQIRNTRTMLQRVSSRLGALAPELEQLAHSDATLVGVERVSKDPAGAGPAIIGTHDRSDDQSAPDLNSVMRRFAETSADSRLLAEALDRQTVALAGLLGRLERLQAETGEVALKARTVPVSSIGPRLQRVVRQAARMAGRQVRLQIDGEQLELDAQLLQTLLEPLTHVLRNAVDHGIEPAGERQLLGKAPEGLISLQIRRAGRALLIECRDDGRGLDTQAIEQRALELGLLDPSQQAAASDPGGLALQPGLSTRRVATQLSGRGIGLDIVQRAVRALRGQVLIESQAGQGMSLQIELPEQVSTVAVSLVRLPEHSFAFSVRGIEALLAADAIELKDQHQPVVSFEGQWLALETLDTRLGWPCGELTAVADLRELVRAGGQSEHERDLHVLVVRLDSGVRRALLTPALSQTRDVIARPLPDWMPAIEGIDGATVLGDGSVAPLLDLPRLLARAPAEAESWGFADASAEPSGSQEHDRTAAAVLSAANSQPLCLVVDDSPSVRDTMQRFMTDLGFEVELATDGVHALGLIEKRLPDLAIIDLEMPLMDGAQLAARLRSDERTHSIGLIMITSRSSDRHRALALDSGVDAFLVKPFSEEELASVVSSCLAQRR